MKEFLQQVFDFAKYLYNEHLPLILLCIILIVILIIFFIVLSKFVSKKKEIKTINENRKNQSIYTQQEIDNIANNVADKSKFISSIPPEKIIDDKTLQESAITKTTKKTTKKADTKKQANHAKSTTNKSVSEKAKATTKKDIKATITEDKKTVNATTTKKTKTTTIKDTNSTVTEDKKPTTSTATNKAKSTKTDTTKNVTPTIETTKKAYTGKWKIKQENSKYIAELHASNGGVLLRTEAYTSLTGVKSGIETIKKNIDDGNFTISSDKYGHYRFKLFSKLNRLICISEDYSSRAKCDKGIESVKRFAKTAYVIIEE